MSRRISAILCLDVVDYTARMGEDPELTLKDLQRILDQIIRPTVRDHSGRIFKLMGDGALVEFQSAASAISATHEILQRLRGDPVMLRAGVHAGDVTVRAGDVFGEAVNMAARLQALAEPGGGLVSKTVAELAGTSADIALKPESSVRLKGFDAPVDAFSIDLEGTQRQARLARMAASQEIRFTRSKDGTSLAWTSTGEGQTIVKAPNWLQHLEYDWTHNPLDGWLQLLSDRYRLIRFDTRNNGLSDRGVQDVSLERMVEDLEAVFDAAEIEQAPVFGLSFGATVAAAFAALRPERVSKLVLMSGFVQGLAKRNRPGEAALGKAIMDLSRGGWNDDYPSARDLMAQAFAPAASPQDQRTYAEYMKLTMDVEDWLKVGEVVDNVDISDLLAKIRCPALILHANRERVHSSDQGRRLAAGIQQARFVALDTTNNTMPVYDRVWPKALSEISGFLESQASA